MGDIEGAVGDLTYPPVFLTTLINRQATKLLSTADLNLQLANLLFYCLDDHQSALNSIKKCLHQDPENKACKKEFRTLKTVGKQMSQLENFVNSEQWHQVLKILLNEGLLEQIKTQVSTLKKTIPLPANSRSFLLAKLEEWACESLVNVKKHALASPHCAVALELNPDSVPALLAKAQIALAAENYDEAIQILNKANEVTGGQDQRVGAQMDRAQRLLRQSKKRDYYKILEVSRDADLKTIKKAYRTMSKKYHPDKYRGDLDPDAVSRKMAEINSAYEVLSNEGTPSPHTTRGAVLMIELRTRYDNGDDPNDHEGQQGYPGGRPFMFQQGGQNFFFQQGGHPFQGGNFKVNFGF